MGEPFSWRWLLPIEGRYMPVILKKLSREFVCVEVDEPVQETKEPVEDKKTI